MIIVADAHIPFVEAYFGAYGELQLIPGRAINSAHVQNADVLLVRSITHVNENLLQDSRVKFVGSVTAGADHLDTKWLDAAGISWSIAAGFNAPPVADYVVSVIAALQHKHLLAKEKIQVGVIGVGHVGRLVVERLKWLNMDIHLCDPIRAQQEKDFVSVSMDEMHDLDLISVHVPLTRGGQHATHHFINQAFLSRQKPGCILLNASRGAVIDSQALLQWGSHLQWCFDVWEHEPTILPAILEKALIATPHIAGYSMQAKIRGIEMLYRLACRKNIIEPQTIAPITMPQQQLVFTDKKLQWEEIVLGVFNPWSITTMMRTLLMPNTTSGHLFDEMRNQFNNRHEFAYTHIIGAHVSDADAMLLAKLGIGLQ